MNKKFCERLKELRGSLSQEDMANKIGTKQTTYSAWERGAKEPLASAIALISSTLGVTSDWLLGLSDVRSPAAQRSDDAAQADESDRTTALEMAAIRRELDRQRREIAAIRALQSSPSVARCCG